MGSPKSMHLWRPALMVLVVVVLGLALCGTPVSVGWASTQAPRVPERWEPMAYFLGAWSSAKGGASGSGHGQRTYELVMGGRYLLHRNSSVFPPGPDGSGGEYHEDWSLYSHDEGRDLLVQRQFNIEGFVNRYVLAEHDADSGRFVWITEAVESGPPGLRARITIRIQDDDHFEEVFELGAADGEFREVQRNRLTRVPPAG